MTASPAARQDAFGTFFYPGPTEVRPEILGAMTRPMIPHRGAAFRALMERLQPGLRRLFGTERTVYVSTSSATGLMEAAVRAVPAGPVLSLVNGAFSERFAALAEACGHSVERLTVQLGQVAPLDEVERRLSVASDEGRPFMAVTVVHSETSTGAMTDVSAVARVARRYHAMCLVDSVTGIGGTPFETDGWGLDFALTGSQKALALPPGLALGTASDRFLASAVDAPARGLYLDILELARYAEKGETPNTPVLPLLYALEAQLEAIEREGLEARLERHARMRDMTHDWVARWGTRTDGAMHVLAPEGARATTVSVVTLPPSVPSSELVRAVGARGFVIGAGYGTLRDSTFRIGHMGDHTPEGLSRCLAACDAALEERLAAAR